MRVQKLANSFDIALLTDFGEFFDFEKAGIRLAQCHKTNYSTS
jgi:hypothetical protein